MLKAPHRPLRQALEVSVRAGEAVLRSEYGLLRLTGLEGGALRVTFTREPEFLDSTDRFVTGGKRNPRARVYEDADSVFLNTGALMARVSKSDGILRAYRADGSLLFSEGGLRTMEAFEARRIARGAQAVTEQIETADGMKTVVREAPTESYKRLYRARLPLAFGDDEALYGLGQPEEGPANLRGRKLYLCQKNRQIALPFFVSTGGYGLLIECGCPFVFSDTKQGSYLYLTAVEELDYYILPGSCEDAVRGYHRLTGLPSALPAWAFGYIQSQERYETQQEVLDIVRRYREEGFGLDCVVMDWCSWPDGQWGQKSFDPVRFPDPKAMTDTLHGMDVRFMISIWPNMNRKSPDNQAFREAGLLLPGGELYDALDPKARALYWKQVNDGLYSKGVDAWWCDSSEPWTSEWSRSEEPLPEETFYETGAAAAQAVGADKGNCFAVYHARTLAEGQKSVSPDRRVVNLTRSAWTGQQRFGTILWSGDTAAKWETLRQQVAIGLDISASGMPFWTLDIGAFFVKQGSAWYWDGEYENGWDDPEYRELFLRWYQYAAFLPVFRGHGTDIRRELSNLKGKEYDIALRFNKTRYQLLPYIYSMACLVAQKGGLIMKPLGFNYPVDGQAKSVSDEFLLGDEMLICPVVEPGASERTVYVPEGEWYELATGWRVKGGKTHIALCPLDTIPVYVRAGAVLPAVKSCLYAGEALRQEPEFWVFPGADGELEFYTDSGDGEMNGTTEIYHWNDAQGALRDSSGADVPFNVFSAANAAYKWNESRRTLVNLRGEEVNTGFFGLLGKGN